MDDKIRNEIALMRYTIIAPLISDTLPQDLSKTELAEPVIGFLKEMLTGPHAVRKTLEKYLGQ